MNDRHPHRIASTILRLRKLHTQKALESIISIKSGYYINTISCLKYAPILSYLITINLKIH